MQFNVIEKLLIDIKIPTLVTRMLLKTNWKTYDLDETAMQFLVSTAKQLPGSDHKGNIGCD